MTNFSELRVFLCTTPTSMRFSFDRLMGIAESIFNQDPLSGHLFLFVNRYRYTEDGRLSIDNNVSERTLRHQAIGRKNWLFLGSEQAGPRAAVLFTILAGAKRHRIEPWTYLRELLLRLHDDDPRLDEMLPDRWAIQHPEAMLTYRLEESRRKAAARKSRRRHARAMSRSR
ncbi:MAG: transposase [Pirellulales bacterium]